MHADTLVLSIREHFAGAQVQLELPDRGAEQQRPVDFELMIVLDTNVVSDLHDGHDASRDSIRPGSASGRSTQERSHAARRPSVR